MRLSPKAFLSLTVLFICFAGVYHIDFIPAAFPKVVLAWLVFLFIPGEALYLLCLGKRTDIGLLERLPIVFCLGLGFISVWGLTAYLLHLSWLTLEIVLLCSALCLVLASLGPWGGNRAYSIPESSAYSLSWTSKTDRSALIILIAAIAVVTAFGFWLGGSLAFKPESKYILEVKQLAPVLVGNRASDRFVHFGFIKKLVGAPEISNQWLSLNYSYNIWHLFMALVSKYTDLNYRWVWSYSILFCVPLSVLAVFALGKVLFNDERLALTCSFIYLINSALFNNYFADLGLWGWIGSPNPRDIGFILMTIISFFVLKYILGKEEKFFWMVVFVGFITLFIHDIDFFFVLVYLLLFALAFLLFRAHDKESLKGLGKLMGVLLLVSIPALFIKSPAGIAPADAITVNPELVMPSISGGKETLKILGTKASELGILPTPIIFVSFLLVPLLFSRLGDRPAFLFLVSTTVLPPLMAYNPAIPFLISKSLAVLNVRVPIETIAAVTGLRTACLFPAVYICAYVFHRGINFVGQWVTDKQSMILACLGLLGGAMVGLISAIQFVPAYLAPLTKYLAGFSWPFYPAWAIFVLAILNLSLLAGERLFCFPSRMLAKLRGFSSHSQAAGLPVIFILIFTVSALVVALPAELEFFTAPARFQTLGQLAEGPEGFKFLEKNVPREAVVLCDPVNSFYLPAYTGHGSTVFGVLKARKEGDLISALKPDLYSSMRLAIIKSNKVEYLYLDWRILNKRLAAEFASLPQYYQLLYQGQDVAVYKVLY